MHPVVDQLIANIGTVLLGKPVQIRLAVTGLLCKGHLLIEDLPGMGKTTLSHALALSLGLSYKRIQFTSDLLPSDLIGVNIFDPKTHTFNYHPGPLFTQIVLADEINRASPKAQSALLEAMEERQISVEGHTHLLPDPFFVIATQNPSDQAGTFPLPESQMDRFFMRIHLGYPPHEAERALLKGSGQRDKLNALQPVMTKIQLVALQNQITRVTCSDNLLDYVQRIIAFTRESRDFGDGLSPRGGLALLTAAKGWAFLAGRSHVLPDDIQAVLPAVAEHRLGSISRAGYHPLSLKIIEQVKVL